LSAWKIVLLLFVRVIDHAEMLAKRVCDRSHRVRRKQPAVRDPCVFRDALP
jgi:hypothetical protein